jgi:putative mRNA 3-end processing factor
MTSKQRQALVLSTSNGLYCPQGDFFIDPWRPVEHAVITHAHADHLRAGSRHYHVATPGEAVARHRLPSEAVVIRHGYGERFQLGGVEVSLHPAGHVLGSSQVRLAAQGEVWVVSGDYKRDPDPTCAPFEVVACDTFVSEATFALPVYRWQETAFVIEEILDWWRYNRARKRASLLFAYALGKAQRVLAELGLRTGQTVVVHGAVGSLTEVYRREGVAMLPTVPVDALAKSDIVESLVIAPPSAAGSPWARRFGDYSSGFCSGWMRVRGDRRRRGYDRGFVLSDHADWPSLLRTFRDTRARRVLLTHGHSDTLCRYLREAGFEAAALATEYGAEE